MEEFYCKVNEVPNVNNWYKEGWSDGYNAGIKEVVEWIRSHYLVKPDKNSLTQFYPFHEIGKGEIEARLKKWRVKC